MLLMVRSDLPSIAWSLAIIPCLLLYTRIGVFRPLAWIIGGFSWALLFAHINQPISLPEQWEGKDVVVIGHVATIPEQYQRATRFEFQVDAALFGRRIEPFPARLRVSWYGRTTEPLSAGQQWILTVRMKRPYGFMNPGGLDYEGWLFRRKITATGYVRVRQLAVLLDAGPGVYWWTRLRESIAQSVDRALDRSTTSGLIQALAVGVRHEISASQWTDLRRSGTAHLMAISGLHIGLVAGFAFMVVARVWRSLSSLCLICPAQLAGAFAALVSGTAYAALAGFSLPTQRALVMLAVLLGALLLRRTATPGHGLSLALIAVLVWDPAAAVSPGFWLSFAAVAIIVYMHAARRRPPHRKLVYWGRLQWGIAIGILPVSLAFFQQASIVAPVVNLLAIPWVSLITLPLTLLGLSVMPVANYLGDGLLQLADQSMQGLMWVLHQAADLPYAQWHSATPGIWALISAVLGAGLLLAPRGVPLRWLGVIYLMPLFLVAPARPVPGAVTFSLIDVGQGLSALVQTNQHTLLYDTGAMRGDHFNVARLAVLPFLRARGITSIDTLLVSHSDNDHSGGAGAILQEMPVKRVISNVREKIPGREPEPCQAGMTWQWDGVDFAILHPDRTQRWRGNNGSCVLQVRAPGGIVLLPGDIQKKAERAMLKRLGKTLKSDILVVPHHGSKTSSTIEFVQAVSPEYVLFPVGYRNRYQLPRPEIQERYRRLGIELLDSTSHGEIRFMIDPLSGIAQPSRYREAARRFWHSQGQNRRE
ncbi:MAG: DNA internalization-related competence protein ComEC/Rec2 [Gammaproteobacteria bacterium]|nr:MAG: DNA internalization-related competence protein ComEC/Rec2 [Gammaproteobacteria bacterium]